MDYLNLGKTNLKISRISLGAMGIGDPAWRSWVLAEDEAQPIVRQALDAGINFFDTCNFYAAGVSEEILGRLLKGFAPRNEVVIATKMGMPMGPAVNDRGYSRKHIMAAIDDSLRRLGTDYVDLYQTHIWDPTTNLEEMMYAFDAVVTSGKVRYIGATDMPAWQFIKCNHIAERCGLHRFVSMQNHYNLIFREDERELIPYCRAEGIGLIPYSPMARGFLCGRERMRDGGQTERARTDDYASKWYDRDEDVKVSELVDALAVQRGVQSGQVAMAWVLSRPWVTAPIFGATRVEHVDAAVEAMALALTDEEIGKLEGAYAPRPGGLTHQ